MHLRDVDRAAQVVTVVVPPLGERLRFAGDMTIVLQERHHQPRTDRYRAIPRAVLRREDRTPILLREHRAGVEHQSEIGRVRRLLDFGKHHTRRRRVGLVFIRPNPAAAVPRETEVEAALLDAIHFAGRLVVAHAVHLVVVAPQ